MTAAELLAQYRVDSDDNAVPPIHSDERVLGWFNEAETEAAIRARLLHEASDPDVCEIEVTAGTARYPLHAAVTEITHITFTPDGTTEPIELELTDRVEQERVRPGWRRLTEQPRYAIQDDTHITLACLPDTDGLLQLECHRTPLEPMVLPTDPVTPGAHTEPEISAQHHRHLVHWVLHRGYSVPDKDLHNPGHAAVAEAEFTRIFGLRPDADLRRATRANVPQHNQAIW